FLRVSFFFMLYGHILDLHSVPTRRSSDLVPQYRGSRGFSVMGKGMPMPAGPPPPRQPAVHGRQVKLLRLESPYGSVGRFQPEERSEEHTSELQSPYDLVCRLLLEKKKKNT